MADLRLIRPTGTRTLTDTLEQRREPLWAVDRRGLAGQTYAEAEYLPETDPPQSYDSRTVERPELLSAVVGLEATSRDSRRGLHLRKLTTNWERHYMPVVRFDLRPIDDVDADQLLEAQLFFREDPAWLMTHRGDVDDSPNSHQGCAEVKVGGVVRVGGPITETVIESRLPNLKFRDQGDLGHPIETGLPSVDATPVVKEWLERRLDLPLSTTPREGVLVITPARPQLSSARIESVPVLANRRRKQHWVRDRRWRVDSSNWRFRCMSRLSDIHIVARFDT